MTIKGGNIAGGNPRRGRVENDFYATDPKAVEMLLDAEPFDLSLALEPCAGNGTIANVLKERGAKKLVTVDLVDRGYKNTIVSDFLVLNIPIKFSSIITNPPFTLAQEFIEKSLTLLQNGGGKLAMFLKIQFLEGKKRTELFNNYPPKYIYVFRNRMATWRDGRPKDPETGKKWATTMCHAWFVWEQGCKDEPIVRWL